MAKVTGRNALVYIGGAVGPNKNKVTLAFNRELQEARVFQDVVPGGPWVDNIPGFRSWTCEINGYYDDTDQVQFSPVNTTTSQQVVIYESRTNLARYWYGNCWFTISEEIDVNNIVTLNILGAFRKGLRIVKSLLIDLEAVMPTRGKQGLIACAA